MKLLITGGGTGGGIYPALAVAAAAIGQNPEDDILWIGSFRPIDRDLVTRAGITFHAVQGGPIVGVGLRVLPSALRLLIGVFQSMGLIRRFKPDALLMTGGWPALPATLAGWLRGIPIVIYQPDLEPGSTIKIVSRIARKIAANSPDSVHFFPEGKAVPCGYPLRSELVLLSEAGDKALARTHFGLDADRPVLLVFGGSKGTGALNNAVLDHLPGLLESAQVIHITGAEHWNKLQSVIDTYRGAAYHPYPYLHSDEMGLALAAADLVVSRAGASTLGEYPLFGLPAVLVPLARAWGYQETNADYLVKLGGAIRLDETRLADDFQDTITGLLADPKRLTAMGQAMRSLRRMDSAQAVLGVIYEAAG